MTGGRSKALDLVAQARRAIAEREGHNLYGVVPPAARELRANGYAARPQNRKPNGDTAPIEGTILDPQDPAPAARALVSAEFTAADARALHRHRGAFWRYGGNCYRQVEDEELRAAVWHFLERSQKLDSKGHAQPFKPTQARVSDVLDA